MNINAHVAIATPKQIEDGWTKPLARKTNIPARWTGGGRGGTIVNCTLQQFAEKFGDPHERPEGVPFYDYTNEKVTGEWYIHTPRGLVTVHDYWWNPKGFLSIGTLYTSDLRALRWAITWLRGHGLDARFGMIGPGDTP